MRLTTSPAALHQEMEHGEFLGGQRGQHLRAPHPPSRHIEPHIPDGELRTAGRHRVARHRAHASGWLGEIERIGQVVVGAGIQAQHQLSEFCSEFDDQTTSMSEVDIAAVVVFRRVVVRAKRVAMVRASSPAVIVCIR